MCWKMRLFRDQVVIRYGVILVGWPADVPFWNFSNKGGATAAQMRIILDLLTAKPPQLYFTPATEKQLRMARLTSSGILPSTLNLECPPLPNFGRSDIGRRHTKYDEEGSTITPRHVCDGPKSAKAIEAEPEDEIKKYLPYIIGGSVAVGVVLLVLIVAASYRRSSKKYRRLHEPAPGGLPTTNAPAPFQQYQPTRRY